MSLVFAEINSTGCCKISHLFELWVESISMYSLALRLVAPLVVPVKSVAAMAMGNFLSFFVHQTS